MYTTWINEKQLIGAYNDLAKIIRESGLIGCKILKMVTK